MIRVFHSHIEVDNFKQKDQPDEIQKMLSKNIKSKHTLDPIGYYVKDDILYLPRGVSVDVLKNHYNTDVEFVMKCDDYDKIDSFDMKFPPKNKIQEDSIDFLTCKNQFAKGYRYGQQALNIDTGDGKTFCAISAISQLKLKTIIIVHKKTLKDQWYNEFKKVSNIKGKRIMILDSKYDMEDVMKGKYNPDIMITTHNVIQSFVRQVNNSSYSDEDRALIEELTMSYLKDKDQEKLERIEIINQKYTHKFEYHWERLREFFKEVRIGLKVIDEVDQHFHNVLMIDFFSNTYKTFYLTATFERSDYQEIIIFNIAFHETYKFGQETYDYDDKVKHIIFVPVFIRTNPTPQEIKSMYIGGYFNGYKYISYELNHPSKKIEHAIQFILNNTKHLEGKLLLSSPSKSSSETFAEIIEKYTGEYTPYIHGSVEDREDKLNNYHYISATFGTIGVGDDIKDLRCLINTTPIGAKRLADQLRGRLRKFKDGKDTYLFYIVDLGVPKAYALYKRIKKVMDFKCKAINEVHLDR